MPIYVVMYNGHTFLTIEAKNEGKAIEELKKHIADSDEFEAELSVCQYTDQQELKDREKNL